MENKKMNHEMDQLAAMFSHLGKATAQLVDQYQQALVERVTVPRTSLLPNAACRKEVLPKAVFGAV